MGNEEIHGYFEQTEALVAQAQEPTEVQITESNKLAKFFNSIKALVGRVCMVGVRPVEPGDQVLESAAFEADFDDLVHEAVRKSRNQANQVGHVEFVNNSEI